MVETHANTRSNAAQVKIPRLDGTNNARLPKDDNKAVSMFDEPIEQRHRIRIEQLATAHHKVLEECCPQLAFHVIYRRATANIHNKIVNRDRKLGFQQAGIETHTKSTEQIWKHLVSMRVPVGNRNRGIRPLSYLIDDQGRPAQTAKQRAQVFAKHFGEIGQKQNMDKCKTLPHRI